MLNKKTKQNLTNSNKYEADPLLRQLKTDKELKKLHNLQNSHLCCTVYFGAVYLYKLSEAVPSIIKPIIGSSVSHNDKQ